MNQSSFLAGALLAGFVLYIAAKGRLPAYTKILWGPVTAKPSVAKEVASAAGGLSSSVQNNAASGLPMFSVFPAM